MTSLGTRLICGFSALLTSDIVLEIVVEVLFSIEVAAVLSGV